jgi:predicted transcriptional regulator YdeE
MGHCLPTNMEMNSFKQTSKWKESIGPTNGKVEENFKDIRIPRQNYFIFLMQKPIEKVTSKIRLL